MVRKRFGIFDAAKKAYGLMAASPAYLFRLALVPLVLQTVVTWGVMTLRPDASPFELYLWELPVNTLIAWFFFVTTRLIVLGERIDHLPQDSSLLLNRDRNMKISILVSLLFMAGTTVFMGILEWISAQKIAGEGPSSLSWASFVLVGIGIWGIRFSVIHVPAAIGYPLRLFIRYVDGLGFSMRLMGLSLVCLFPIFILAQILISAFLPVSINDITQEHLRTMALIGQPLTVLWVFIYNMAAAFALKEMFGWEKKA